MWMLCSCDILYLYDVRFFGADKQVENGSGTVEGRSSGIERGGFRA